MDIQNETARFQRKLSGSISRFEVWLDKAGYAGYDLYDLWSTSYGKRAKRLFHQNKYLGAGFVIPVFLTDFIWPGVRKFVAEKKRYVTADAHFAKAYILQYQRTGDVEMLQKAVSLAEDMLSYASPGYSGPCWGYPFDWQTNRGLWKKGVPFITTTPYAYFVLTALFDITQEPSYLDVAGRIAEFACKDLNKTTLPNGTVSSSYSPLDHTSIVNANAYRANLLIDSASRFDNKTHFAEAEENIRFILEAQGQDGSWLYDVANPHDKFVDNFHTCFVLKALYQINRRLKRADIADVLQSGYDFYLKNLFDAAGKPIPFSHVDRTQLVKREMYDYAEGISLGVLMADDIPEALGVAVRLANQLIDDYQTDKGYYIARELILNKKLRLPMPRWPQAQLFAALSALQYKLDAAPGEK